MKLPVNRWPNGCRRGIWKIMKYIRWQTMQLNDMNFYLKKDPASAEDAAYVQNLQIDDIVGITINSQTNQVSAIEKVFAVNEDGEFATDVIWLQ